MRIKILILIGIVCAFPGCAPPASPPAETEAVVTQPIAASGAPRFEATVSAEDQVAIPEGSPIRVRRASQGLRFAGYVADASTQFTTAGAALRIDGANERAFAGNTVRVSLRAKGVDGATAFTVAYTTNDNGNSGWRNLPLTDSFETVAFEYKVPQLVRGAGDFIGIMPPQTGAVEVTNVVVEIIP